MSIFTSVILTTLPSLSISLCLLYLLLRNLETPTLPRSAALTHFLIALFFTPLADLLARFWLVQPLLPLLLAALIPLLLSQLLLSVPLFYLTRLLSHYYSLLSPFLSALFTAFSYLPSAKLSPSLSTALSDLQASFQNLTRSLNFNDLVARINIPQNASLALANLTQTLSFLSSQPLGLDLSDRSISRDTHDAFRELLSSLRTYLNSLSADLLAEVPPRTLAAFQRLQSSLDTFLSSFSLHHVLSTSTLPPELVQSFLAFRDALVNFLHSVDPDQLFADTKAPQSARKAFTDTLNLLRNGDTTPFSNFATHLPSFPSVKNVSSFFPFPVNWTNVILSALFFATLVAFLYLLRALVHELAKWLLTRRYLSVATRDARGWLLSAALSALGMGTVQAISTSVTVGVVHAYTQVSGMPWLLSLHVVSTVPVHVAAQVEVARAAVRTDVFGKAGGATKPFLAVVCLVAVVNAWWDYFAVLLGIASLMALKWGRFLCIIDIVLFCGGIWWVRKVFIETVRAEEEWIQEQQRKDD